jgi:RNA polymerase sigma factor (sigma-70 family)
MSTSKRRVAAAGGRRFAGPTEALVGACRAGDERAWAELVRICTPLVWTVARSFGLRPADCDDVCQLTWIRVFENIDSLREPGKVSTWIATTARRESMRVLARSDRHVPVGDGSSFSEAPDADATPEEVAVARADDELAAAAFRLLPRQHQELLGMLIAEPPMSYDQISDALAMPRGSIGPTRARILRSMRQSMLAAAS